MDNVTHASTVTPDPETQALRVALDARDRIFALADIEYASGNHDAGLVLETQAIALELAVSDSFGVPVAGSLACV